MKQILKKLIDFIAFLLSIVFNQSLFNAWRYLKNRIFSFSVSRKLKSAGKDFSIDINSIIVSHGNISIGDNFRALKNLRLDAVCRFNSKNYNPKIIIGDNVYLNTDCHIGCQHRLEFAAFHRFSFAGYMQKISQN